MTDMPHLVEKDWSGRVAELAAKSIAGMLSQEEQAEYEQLVRLIEIIRDLQRDFAHG